MMGCQLHQLDYMQIVCTLLQIDNHTSTPSLISEMLFLLPNQQCQSTEGDTKSITTVSFIPKTLFLGICLNLE